MLKKEIVAAIVNGKFPLFNFSGQFTDKEIVLGVVKKRGDYLESVSDELKDDREVVMAAVKNYGCALEYASDRLKGDKEVVLAAVSEDGSAIQYVSYKLECYKEVVIATIEKSGWAYFYCVEEMQRDPDVIALANKNLKQFGKSVENYLCKELENLKKKYEVDELVLALEMEIAEMEIARLLSSGVIKKEVEASIVKRL